MTENSHSEANVTDISSGGKDSPGRLMKKRLGTKQAITVASMISKLSTDERLVIDIDNQAQSIFMAAGLLMDNSERDFSLVLSDLMGLTDDFDFKSYRERADEESKDEAAREAEYLEVDKTRMNWRQFRLSDSQVREKMNDDIIDRFGKTDLDTIPRLLEEIVQEDNFENFIKSCTQFYKTASGLSGVFQSLSKDKKPTASKTKKS